MALLTLTFLPLLSDAMLLMQLRRRPKNSLRRPRKKPKKIPTRWKRNLPLPTLPRWRMTRTQMSEVTLYHLPTPSTKLPQPYYKKDWQIKWTNTYKKIPIRFGKPTAHAIHIIRRLAEVGYRAGQ